jgi:DNA helicase-2/ATP-dependent DNA helicase PcrA
MRTLFGRTSYNAISRFIDEIPSEALEGREHQERAGGFGRPGFGSARSAGENRFDSAPQPRTFGSFAQKPATGSVLQPAKLAHHGQAAGIDWKVGEKVKHGKWGVGTVVSVKGKGDDVELDIAFPSPVGIKKLLAKFAPIEKA